MNKVLVDGHYGAVSLNIGSMLYKRDDLEVVLLEDKTSFTPEQRVSLLNAADIVILCQSAATVTETLPLIENKAVRVIDTSNVFRIAPNWVYGLPELGQEQSRRIAQARFVAAPGAIAVGASLLVNPLIRAKIMPPYQPLVINSVVGYSRGGSNMIAMYEDPAKKRQLSGSRQYGLDQSMMLQKELMRSCGLSYRPSINPMIDGFPNGAMVTVPLHLRTLSKRLHSKQIWEYLVRAYDGSPLVRVADFDSSVKQLDGFLAANARAGTDHIELFCFGDNDICLLAARYDNLGKGGAGGVMQCLNLMLGEPETLGLRMY